MRSYVFVALIFLFSISLVYANTFYADIPAKSGSTVNVECGWFGTSNWMGQCQASSCPSHILENWVEIDRSSGWEGVLTTIGEKFIGTFDQKKAEEIMNARKLKLARQIYSHIGFPCLSGEKVLCCKVGLWELAKFQFAK